MNLLCGDPVPGGSAAVSWSLMPPADAALERDAGPRKLLKHVHYITNMSGV